MNVKIVKPTEQEIRQFLENAEIDVLQKLKVEIDSCHNDKLHQSLSMINDSIHYSIMMISAYLTKISKIVEKQEENQDMEDINTNLGYIEKEIEELRKCSRHIDFVSNAYNQ